MTMGKTINEMTKREKLHYAREAISGGKSRGDVAAELGYSTYRSLDNAFRLEGYTFDKVTGNYYINEETSSTQNINLRVSKADEVVALFAKGKWNAKEIAEKLDFENTRSLALYMTSKGYVWNADRDNYILEKGSSTAFGATGAAPRDHENQSESSRVLAVPSTTESGAMGRYLPLLHYLEENQEILMGLIEKVVTEAAPKGLPRYSIPGINVTKSVHMSNQLDQMVRDYSSEKKIAQRDLFEVALVRFFLEFGYEREVTTLLENG